MQNTLLGSVVAIQNPSRLDFNHWFKDGNDAGHLATELFPEYRVSNGVLYISSLSVSIEAAIAAQEVYRDWLFNFVKKNQVVVKLPEKGQVNVLLAELEKAWNLMHFEDTKKKGRIPIIPTYEQVLGFRRLACLHFVNAVKVHLDQPLFLELPMEYQELDASGRIIANLTENLKKTAAAKGLSQEDEVNGARQLYFLGGKEGDFMRAGFSRFKAQKLYALFTIDKRFPDEGFADQIIAGKLNWSAVDKDTILTLRDEGSVDDIAACLQAKKKVNKVKIMDYTKITALFDQHPVESHKRALSAVLKNDSGPLSKYTSRAADLNLADAAVMESDPIMMKALADIRAERKAVSEIKSA